MFADQMSEHDLICEIRSRQGGGGTATRAISRDALIARGAPALADMLMRACLKYPELATELSCFEATPRAVEHARTANTVPSVSPVKRDATSDPYMVGSCAAMQVVFHAIRRFATTDAPILVTGESGTGKELAARAIHERSSYAKGPFVAVNCAGLPASLIASELFGHEKGSFTGALARRIGRIEEAAGGTLFLDEIGDLPHDLQANLLRFLQDRTIQRVGSNQNIRIDTRVVAATNVDLERAVVDGRFRQDLFFRLDVLRIHLPPLRAREGDVELLIRYFLTQAAREFGVDPAPSIEPETMKRLKAYPWPGNVRELISKIRRAVVMAGDRAIAMSDFDLNGPSTTLAPCRPAAAAEFRTAEPGQPDLAPDLATARARAERDAIADALQKSQFNVTRAARELGVSRVTMYKLMDRYNIQR